MTAFISYRRGDSPAHAGRLHQNLRGAFGERSVFMDTDSIAPGAQWKPELNNSIRDARVVLVVIGPQWLKASDEFGRRRIDEPGDWVRTEIVKAIEYGKEIIPILVGGALLPPSAALPEELCRLLDYQAVELRDNYWNHDVQLVISRLGDGKTPGGENQVNKDGAPRKTSPYPIPPVHRPEPMSEDAIRRAVELDLKGWAVLVSALPEDTSAARQELFKEFTFGSFVDAVSFMALVAPGCDISQHHPRWENIWCTLRVYLSTWDIKHRISDRDIQMARYFDAAHAGFTSEKERKQ